MLKTGTIILFTGLLVLVFGTWSVFSSSRFPFTIEEEVQRWQQREEESSKNMQMDMHINVSMKPNGLEEIQILQSRHRPERRKAIFYNVYIKPQSPHRSMDLVKEQLNQIRNATGHKSTQIYYNMIGSPLFTKKTLCSNCQQLGYYERAQEVVTLQEMYDYCQKHPSDLVTYLHNKGSFHPSAGANVTRRLSTRGVLSEECQSLAVEKCNLCSASFSTFPHSHVPGNIFTAECRYISQLVPPVNYEQRRRDICTFIHSQVNSTRRNTKIFCPPANASHLETHIGYGFGRYAMERWIAGHPSLISCIVFTNHTKRDFPTGWETWFPSLERSKKRRQRLTAQQAISLLYLMHEYAHLYAEHNPRESEFCKSYFGDKMKCPMASLAYRKALNASRAHK